MRHNLKVPFAEKDQAKKLGARWDAARKLWYVDGGIDLALFAHWQPIPHDPARRVSAGAPQRSVSSERVSAAEPKAASRSAALPRVCDCLPWEDCDKCRLPSWPAPQGGR